MLRQISVVAVALLLVAGTAFAVEGNGADKPKTTKKPPAEKFVVEAAQGNLLEVQLGELAGHKSQNDAVKQFAQRMVKDHTAAQEKLAAAAQSANLTLPAQLDAKRQKIVDKLSSLDGAEFDKQYIGAMVRDHQQDVRMHEMAAKQLDNQAVKDYAAEVLPTLRGHMDQAKQIAKEIGVAGPDKDKMAKPKKDKAPKDKDKDKDRDGADKDKGDAQ